MRPRLLVLADEEDVAALPPARHVADQRAAGHAHAVGPLDRLEVDHVGAERGEHAGRGRAGPPGGGVEHADARERQRVARRARRAPARRGCAGGSIASVCSPSRGVGSRQRGILVVDPIGRARLQEAAATGSSRTRRAPRTARAPSRCARRSRAPPGCAAAPRARRSRRWCAASSTRARPRSTRPCAPSARSIARELLVLEQVGALDQQQEVAVLLARVGVEADPAVERGLDRRQLDRCAPACPRASGRPEQAVQAGPCTSCPRCSSPRAARSRRARRARARARAARPRARPPPRTCRRPTRWCARRP